MTTRSAILLAALAWVLLPLRAFAGMQMTFFVVEKEKIAALQKSPGKEIEKLLTVTDAARVLDIDKAWHGIHFLLTGSADPVRGVRSLVIFGGKEIGKDIGYGPARLLLPAEVKEIAKALKEESAGKLSSRYDPKKMEKLQIYPDIWVRDGKEALDYLLEYYRQLAVFYEKAAEQGSALLLVIS